MKKTGFFYVLIVIFILTCGIISAANGQDYAMPRVDLIDLEKPGILGLPNELERSRAYLMFQSENANFVWPVTVSFEDGTALGFDKKSYILEFFRDESFTERQNVVVNEDWGAYSRYALKANNYDSTLARNAVSSEIIGLMNGSSGIFPESPNGGTSAGIPVELYADREYLGIYVWTIVPDPWMFGMDADNENGIVLLGENGQAPAVLFMEETDNVAYSGWRVLSGPKDTPEGLASITEKLNRIIRFVKESSDEEFREHFSEYFDLDASLNYYCFCDYTDTTDNMGRNMLLVTQDGSVWYPILYNLQTSFGLYYNGEGVYSPENRIEDFQGGSSLFWTRLAGIFSQELAERYWKLRSNILKESLIMGMFEAFQTGIPEEAWERERETWPDVPGLDFGIESVRELIQAREPFVDDIFSQIMPRPEQKIDPRLVFSLELPFRGKNGSYLDTGVNLYEEEMDFTIFLKFKTGQQDPGNIVILSNSNNDQHGLLVQAAGNGTDDYTAYYAGAHVYEAMNGVEEDGYAYHTIRKQGDEYTFFTRGVNDRRQIVSAVPTEITTNLILGGRSYLEWDGNQVVTDFYKGRISQCLVYNEALEEEEILSILEMLKSE